MVKLRRGLKKDLKFLRKMYQLSQKLIISGYDSVAVEKLDQMIEDWKDELEELVRKSKL